MISIVKIEGSDNILEIIGDLEEIFPNLKGKIYPEERYAKKLNDFAEVYCVKYNGEVAGVVVFYANDFQSMEAYISQFGIKSSFKRMGLGTYMLHECENVIRNRGLKAIRLEVGESNVNAIAFYKKNGFSKDTVKEAGRLYMLKRL